MSWFNVWDGLKKKTCRYLLQRYLGQFLEERLNLEQLKIELYDGTATIKDVSLKIEAINELCEAQSWDLEVVKGHIGEINVTVPWNALMTKDSSIEVSNLSITLRPIKRQSRGTSMLESMWSSASSSIQMAEECMKQNDECSDGLMEMNQNSIVGLEKFAETIDNVLNRIDAKFKNTELRLEYFIEEKNTTISLVMVIEEFVYKNGTGCDKTNTVSNTDSNPTNNYAENVNLLPSFAKHKVKIRGLTLYSGEFHTFESLTRSDSRYRTNTKDLNTVSHVQIPFLEIKDEQKIEINMKQSEEINGPKIGLNIELGSIYSFINPRQIHLILKMVEAFNEDVSLKSDNKMTDKNTSFFDNVRNYSGECNMVGNLGNRECWHDIHENPLIYEHKSNFYCDSINSSISSSSIATNSTRLHRLMDNNCQMCGEILNFSIRIHSYTGIFLHDNIIVENSPKSSLLKKESVINASHEAQNFFSNAHTFNSTRSLQTKSHIYLCTSLIYANGIQRRLKNDVLFNGTMTSASFDLYEVLDNVMTPLILFIPKEDDHKMNQNIPPFSMNFKTRTSYNSKEYSNSLFEIHLDKSILEFDVSIYDRLSSISTPSPFSYCTDSYNDNAQNCNQEEVSKSSINITVTSPELNVKLRFPIVDSRPLDDPNRNPWWKQNIRSDFLYLSLRNLTLYIKTNIIDLNAHEINGFYCQQENVEKQHILRTSNKGNDSKSSPMTDVYPRIVINLQPLSSASANNMKQNKCENYRNMCDDKLSNSLPFSSRRECRQSDTMHSQQDTQQIKCESFLLPGDKKEINDFSIGTAMNSKLSIKINLPFAIVCFESKQLYEIIYNRLNSDLFMWEPLSPLYNKSTNDKNQQLSDINKSLMTMGMMDSMYIPSTQQLDPYDIYDEIDDKLKCSIECSEYMKNSLNMNPTVDSVYFSTHEGKQNLRQKSFMQKKQTHNISLELLIEEGCLMFFTPVRNVQSNVQPEQLGKFDLRTKKFQIFVVNGFKEDDNLGYVCLQANSLEIYHCGLVPFGTPTSMDMFQEEDNEWMRSIFYLTPTGLTKRNTIGIKERDIFSLVIEIKKNPDQKIKRLKITSGIQKITMRHHPVLSPYIWLNQLIDFLDVIEYPIEGYVPYAIITEIQIKLWDCAIDYRPKNFNYRSVIEVGTFTISSNIISSIAGCNLRLVLEESILSIAPFDPVKESHLDTKISCIPSDNLVTVLDIGLFDISLRIKDDATQKNPKLDLRCSIYDSHLRTCSDSASALFDLITYVANDGDIIIDNKDSPSDHIDLNLDNSYASNVDRISVLSDVPNDPEEMQKAQKQQERVNLLMAEAIQEIVKANNMNSKEHAYKKYNKSGAEVYYFPDESCRSNPKMKMNESDEFNDDNSEFCDILNFESNIILNSYCDKRNIENPLPQVKEELGDVYNESDDEGYCIVDNKKPYLKQFGINVQIPNESSLRIVENHFCLPAAEPDLLKAPDNFPMAISRYTLCEMTFTWHLYGGNDFPKDPLLKDQIKYPKKENVQMSETYKHGVSEGTQNVSAIGKKSKEKLTWKTIGGVDRNHEILVEMQFTKVRFSHEEYPLNTSHSSRQVLIVTDAEIRDRLQTSEIKKFLYHPNTNAIVNKNTQNLLVLKALHIRPNPKQSSVNECSLRISMLPLRLNIDQDTLLFLADFFTNIGEKSTDMHCTNRQGSPLSGVSTQPVMTVDEIEETYAKKVVSNNLELLMNDETEEPTICTLKDEQQQVSQEGNSEIYFREVLFSPELPICFDYHGRRIEFSRGPLVGLLMGLGQLECSEIRLKKIKFRRGILGFEKLLKYLCKEWLTDIKKNQLSKILKGVGPTKAFKQLFDGIYDLFKLPIEQYQKDGRIIRGLQLGAQSFTSRTALAALEITARIIQILQFTAETAFDMVSPGPSVRKSRRNAKGKRKRTTRPKDIREGVTNAYLIVKEGINDSANNLIETAVSEHDQKGYAGAVGAVMRQIPQLVVCPAVLATQATTNIIGGVKSSLVPEAKIEAREKWKDDTE